MVVPEVLDDERHAVLEAIARTHVARGEQLGAVPKNDH